jgi:hypothetical protein
MRRLNNSHSIDPEVALMVQGFECSSTAVAQPRSHRYGCCVAHMSGAVEHFDRAKLKAEHMIVMMSDSSLADTLGSLLHFIQ